MSSYSSRLLSPPHHQVTPYNRTNGDSNITITCSKHLLTSYLIPDLLLLAAYLYSMYVFRRVLPEHLSTFMETVSWTKHWLGIFYCTVCTHINTPQVALYMFWPKRELRWYTDCSDQMPSPRRNENHWLKPWRNANPIGFGWDQPNRQYLGLTERKLGLSLSMERRLYGLSPCTVRVHVWTGAYMYTYVHVHSVSWSAHAYIHVHGLSIRYM